MEKMKNTPTNTCKNRIYDTPQKFYDMFLYSNLSGKFKYIHILSKYHKSTSHLIKCDA